MTVLGAILAGPDDAVLWCCNELFAPGADAPSAFGPKMAVNAMACIAGAGAGPRHIIAQADGAILAAGCFDSAVKAAGAALRRAVMANAADFDREPDRFLGLTYATAGYSHRAGRMLTYRLSAWGFFAAEIDPQVLAPELPGASEHWRPQDNPSALSAARWQVAQLRDNGRPGAGVGTLTVATLQPGSITIRTIPEFDAAATRCERTEAELTA